MANTFRRQPISHNMPTDDTKLWHINNFKGVQQLENPLVADPNSAYMAKNVYRNDVGNLTVRPRLEPSGKRPINETGDIFGYWEYNGQYFWYTSTALKTALSTDIISLSIDGSKGCTMQIYESKPYFLVYASNLAFYKFDNGQFSIVDPYLPLTSSTGDVSADIYNQLSPYINRGTRVELSETSDNMIGTDTDNTRVIIDTQSLIVDESYIDGIDIDSIDIGSNATMVDSNHYIIFNDKPIISNVSSIPHNNNYISISTVYNTGVRWHIKTYTLAFKWSNIRGFGYIISDNVLKVYIVQSNKVGISKYATLPSYYGQVYLNVDVTRYEISLDNISPVQKYTYTSRTHFSLPDKIDINTTNSEVYVVGIVSSTILLYGKMKYASDSSLEHYYLFTKNLDVNVDETNISSYDLHTFKSDILAFVRNYVNDRTVDLQLRSEVFVDCISYVSANENEILQAAVLLSFSKTQVYYTNNYRYIKLGYSGRQCIIEHVDNKLIYRGGLSFTGTITNDKFSNIVSIQYADNNQILVISSDNKLLQVFIDSHKVYTWDSNTKSNITSIVCAISDITKSLNITDGIVTILSYTFGITGTLEIRSTDEYPVLNTLSANILTSFFLDNTYWFITDKYIFGTDRNRIDFWGYSKYFELNKTANASIRISDTSFWVFYEDGVYLIYKSSASGDTTSLGQQYWRITQTAQSNSCGFKNAVSTLPAVGTTIASVTTVTTQDISYVTMRKYMQTDDRILQALTLKIADYIRNLIKETEDIHIASYKYLTLYAFNKYKIKNNQHVPNGCSIVVFDSQFNEWWLWEFPVNKVYQFTKTKDNIDILLKTGNNYSILNLAELETKFTLGIRQFEIYADILGDSKVYGNIKPIDWYWESALSSFGSIDFRKQLLQTMFTFTDIGEDSNVTCEYSFDVYRKDFVDIKAKDVQTDVKLAKNKYQRTYIATYNYLQLRLQNLERKSYYEPGEILETCTKPKLAAITCKYRYLPGIGVK